MKRLEVTEYLSNPTDLTPGRARTVQVERDDAEGRVRVDKAAFARLWRGATFVKVQRVERVAGYLNRRRA